MEKIMGKSIFEGIVIGEPYLRSKKQLGVKNIKLKLICCKMRWIDLRKLFKEQSKN